MDKQPQHLIPPAWQHINFCPACGVENSIPKAKRTFRFECHQCQYTQFFNPSIGVVGIVINARNEALLLIRNKDPKKGCFGLPGGFADIHESAESALSREIFEETRLRVTNDQFTYLCSDTNIYPYQGVTYHVIDLFYLCRVPNFDDVIIEASEISGFVASIPNETHLKNMAFDSNRAALERYYSSV